MTSGSSIIKEEIRKTPRTANEYPINSLGLEGLSLEWIVKSLKRGGRAFLIIPDGILSRVGGKKLRDYILHECYLDAVVSLPDRTFFANFERTYIIAFTKKNDPADKQTDPVFTYLASEIGEKLTSVRREEIDKDDMPQMEALFRIFNAAKTSTKSVVEGMSGRCKIQAFSRFRDESHWVVDRWWTQDERIAVGADSAIKIASKGDLDKQKDYLTALLSDYSSFISADPLAGASAKEVVLGDTTLFEIFIGKRVLRKDVTKDTTKIPVYSANVVTPMGYIETSNVKNFNNSTLLWGIDGNFDFNLIPSGQKFATTDHCGAIQVLDPAIHPDYVLYALHVARVGESFDRAFRASLTNMRKFVLRIPTKANGSFDLAMQKKIATRFAEMQSKISGLKTAKAGFDDIFNRYIASTA
ncbi:MAG: N-6 DNA methylase [Pseudolabrys sp.]|nr:N-6 DNA methylase [Pseudolabrys sp.]